MAEWTRSDNGRSKVKVSQGWKGKMVKRSDGFGVEAKEESISLAGQWIITEALRRDPT